MWMEDPGNGVLPTQGLSALKYGLEQSRTANHGVMIRTT